MQIRRGWRFTHLNVGVYVVLSVLIAALAAGLHQATGTLFYHYIERFSWVDAYYFSVITLTTVGYGDMSPRTSIGKIFTTIYILVGVGIITAFITTFAKYRTERRIAAKKKS